MKHRRAAALPSRRHLLRPGLVLLLAVFEWPLIVANPVVDPWWAAPPSSATIRKLPEIPTADFYEVVGSMVSSAEQELQKRPIILLSEAQARRFTGDYYTCPKGKRPFLMRALFAPARNGRFWLYRIEREIWVLHESVAVDAVSSRTAIVANLDFEPARAYVTTSVVK